jgi:hypothetical protein
MHVERNLQRVQKNKVQYQSHKVLLTAFQRVADVIVVVV